MAPVASAGAFAACEGMEWLWCVSS